MNQEHHTENRSRSHHHRYHHRRRRKRYSRERQSLHSRENAFMLMCAGFVVILMIILIPLLANFMETL